MKQKHIFLEGESPNLKTKYCHQIPWKTENRVATYRAILKFQQIFTKILALYILKTKMILDNLNLWYANNKKEANLGSML